VQRKEKKEILSSEEVSKVSGGYIYEHKKDENAENLAGELQDANKVEQMPGAEYPWPPHGFGGHFGEHHPHHHHHHHHNHQNGFGFKPMMPGEAPNPHDDLKKEN